MALPKQIFGFGSALLFIPRGICRSQSFQQWSKDCRKESKKTNSLGIYEAWRLSVNKSNKLRMHLGSASVGMSLEGGGCAVSGLGICDLSQSRDGRTKSLIFPHKVPLEGDDRFVQISWQSEKNMTEPVCVFESVCVCEARQDAWNKSQHPPEAVSVITEKEKLSDRTRRQREGERDRQVGRQW